MSKNIWYKLSLLSSAFALVFASPLSVAKDAEIEYEEAQASERAAKVEDLNAKKEAKEAEKQAKLAAEKAEKDAKIAALNAEKQAKEAEKQAKLAAQKQLKLAALDTDKQTQPAQALPKENKKPSSVADDAFETLKTSLEQEKKTKEKAREEFPKSAILSKDLKNPKNFNGLPSKAIEKVPGLAKEKGVQFITLKEAVQTAVVTNPDVLQSYKNFEAAVREADAAWGKYLPSVDLTHTVGTEDRTDPLVVSDRPNGRLGGSFAKRQTSLSLRQMLFDGFFTKTEVERLSRTSRARLFELEETSNAIALETTKAYSDLLRFRKLTELAEDNYVAHKVIYEQLVIKAKAGVGKKSDVEQAKSRLALAEYNMNVEGSNLHDIEARFQKVVGFIPPEEVDSATPVNKDVPNEIKDAILYAQRNNPKLLATIEDALSQQALLDNKDAAFMPKVNLVLRTDRGRDLNAYEGYHANNVAEVVMTWNLFNGNSDVNFKRKELAALEATIDRRDKFCRDIRVELEIAYNDIKKLMEQYNYLDARAISIEKARDAYRKQFEIGQRTLIDLLNSENELYEAKRLLTNVQNDLAFAYGRSHYQMGSILGTLGVIRYASTTTAPHPSDLSELGADAKVCPAEAPVPYKANRKNLDARANDFINAPKQDTPASDSLNKDFKEMVNEAKPQ